MVVTLGNETTALVPLPTVDRTKFIGGSDIAALLNCAPPTWERNTPVALWKDKSTPRAEEATTGVKRRGKRWEGVVAEMLVDELERAGHKVEVLGANKRYTDPDVPYFACEIDFEVRLDDEQEITNVELKTVHPFKAREWGESGTDEAPVWYAAQGAWGLGVTRRRRCLIAPLFGADEIKVFPMLAVPSTIEAIRARAKVFWEEHVLTGIPPEALQLSDLDLIFPSETPELSIVADDELTAYLLRLRAIDREINARQAEYDALEFAVKRRMQDATEIILSAGNTAATWKGRKHSHLDQGALNAAHPKIVKEFTKKGITRVFTLKSFAWKE